MGMLDRHRQILIDEDRLKRLKREAVPRRVPVAVFVRKAIDEQVPR
jgi:hypothetical protein